MIETNRDPILEELLRVNKPKIGEMYPDYPCDRCARDRDRCRYFRDCAGWRGWYHRMHAEKDRLFGIRRENSGRRKK